MSDAEILRWAAAHIIPVGIRARELEEIKRRLLAIAARLATSTEAVASS